MYQRILVAVDGSSTSLAGLAQGICLAQATGGRLLLVYVFNVLIGAEYGMHVDASAVATALRASGVEVLDHAAAIVARTHVPFERQLIESSGRPADELVRAAKAWSADVIVMGTHGRRGLKRLALGSDAELVLRLSPVPVLMVREVPEAALSTAVESP